MNSTNNSPPGISTVNDYLISLDTAATQLGYSVSGLRKLIRKKAIQFFQISPHAAIKFRQEWLDEFVEAKTIKPSRPLPPKPKPKKVRPALPANVKANQALYNL